MISHLWRSLDLQSAREESANLSRKYVIGSFSVVSETNFGRV